MGTECKAKPYEFQPLGNRAVVAGFDGGTITSDGGALLLRELEAKRRIIRQFAECFVGYRDPERIEHTVEELVGSESMDWRWDTRISTITSGCGTTRCWRCWWKVDPTGQDRLREPDRGKALAGKSTLNGLELTPEGASAESRYNKIGVNPEQVEEFFLWVFVLAQGKAPAELVLDFDASNWICLLTGPARPRCGPTSCGCGFRRSLTCCCTSCVAGL
jgi:hypothetical protein